jgi:hypothetical protein
MITAFNLYKLLVADFFPKCVKCAHYRPGVVGNGYCKIYGDILEARVSKNAHYCGLEGISFKKAENIKPLYNKNN